MTKSFLLLVACVVLVASGCGLPEIPTAKTQAAKQPKKKVSTAKAPAKTANAPQKKSSTATTTKPKTNSAPRGKYIHELTAEDHFRKAVGSFKYDSDIYLETFRLCRHKMAYEQKEILAEAEKLQRTNKFSSQLESNVNTAFANLDHRKNRDLYEKPPAGLPTLAKLHVALTQAVAEHERALNEIYRPLGKAIDARKFEGDAPQEALERGIADGKASLAKWQADLDAALAAWEAAKDKECEQAARAKKK